ncbi:hypothetical protein [Microbacterium sp. 77mftsu3.1]|uniref:hypothetical protein n=1 Tax=Microbacterium sp. 77mftsu3.1 TaxID=1761802 RepID=UPI000368E479|nr:hypothetical protein [Microbacterium sp. 77mftsu3.1]SDH32926.1 hypothetical protein SAMN04488590_3041 [Microbacterium sp. 77mftsu3.1]
MRPTARRAWVIALSVTCVVLAGALGVVTVGVVTKLTADAPSAAATPTPTPTLALEPGEQAANDAVALHARASEALTAGLYSEATRLAKGARALYLEAGDEGSAGAAGQLLDEIERARTAPVGDLGQSGSSGF